MYWDLFNFTTVSILNFFQINRHTMKIFEIENLSVTKEQGNAIYKSIMKSEKINKNGDKYYTYK